MDWLPKLVKELRLLQAGRFYTLLVCIAAIVPLGCVIAVIVFLDYVKELL